MLFLKMYLGFSLLTFVMFELHLHSVSHALKIKYDIKPKEQKDLCGLMFIHIKLFIACFIPLMNAVCMYMLMFNSEELEEIYKNSAKSALNCKGE